MQKYIQDTIRNNLRPVISGLTKPQQRAMTEMMRGLFTAQEPILAQLAQYEDISVKKQAEKYSHHLGNIDITEDVEEVALRKAMQQLRKDTIIAYDLTDIAKEYARKMEKLRNVWDGSKRKVAPGFQLHGVGMNNILLTLQVHDDDHFTLPQVRRDIIEELAPKFDRKGIWVFDRGNDSKGFFRELRQVHNVRYIARVKENRYVVLKETGEYLPVKNVPAGVHQVYLLNWHDMKIDRTIGELTLVIHEHLKEKEPIRLLTNLVWANYGTKRIVTMYLERWGVENIFRRAKTKFDLEKIRVLSYQKFVNLVALIQLAIIVSSAAFLAIQKSTNTLILGVLSLYQSFLDWRNLTFNIDSFITFMQSSLKPLQKKEKPPSLQLNLFSWRQEKGFA